MSEPKTDADEGPGTASAQTGPVVIDLGDPDEPSDLRPADAPPVPESEPATGGTPAMAMLAQLADRPVSPLRRWFFGLAGAVVSALVALAVWSAIEALFARSPLLGGALSFLLAGFLIVALLVVLGELAALSRLGQIEKIRTAAQEVRRRGDLDAARKLATRLSRFYGTRKDLRWQADGLDRALAESFDADAVLGHTEQVLMPALDAQALKEVEAAARQVATVTALVPLALADLVVALVSNLRMIRRIAEIYGGRAGTLGSWRLTRAVLRHLVATGALAVGDDLIGSIAGGGVMSQVSRRFGEGVVNGALTARVGLAAIEVSRPLSFHDIARPSVGKTVQRSLVGLFGPGRKPAKTEEDI